jgi:cellulose synthase/poly-beta-1,6-N-acetylglucosamine synthase-like glycosyltransferase
VNVLQAIYDALYQGWTFFLVFFVLVSIVMLSRQLVAAYFYRQFRQGRILQMEHKKVDTTIFVTIFDESPELLRRSLSGVRASFDKHCSKVALVAIVDGYDLYPDKGKMLVDVASEFSDLVFVTNARSKRKNLRNMFHEARDRGMLYEYSCFLDSDTILDDEDVARELLRPLQDPAIGGVTTSQRALYVNTIPERIGDWLENARLFSSMAAGSLFGQVGCLPGRLYAVRTSIIKDKMDDLVEDYWTFFGNRAQCFAGDDRVLTNFVLQAGYRTCMVPTAGVKTLVPETFSKMFKTWERWGRSSQGYTLRSVRWLVRRPVILFQYLSDMFISLATVYLVAFHWPYHMIMGDSMQPLVEAMVMAVVGMGMTIMARQVPHLYSTPRDILLIPVFAIAITIGQFVRVKALFTPHLIGVWGTREGADRDKSSQVWVDCVWERGALRVITNSTTSLNVQVKNVVLPMQSRAQFR